MEHFHTIDVARDWIKQFVPRLRFMRVCSNIILTDWNDLLRPNGLIGVL